MLIFTPTPNLESLPNVDVSGLWEEVRLFRENTRGKNAKLNNQTSSYSDALNCCLTELPVFMTIYF